MDRFNKQMSRLLTNIIGGYAALEKSHGVCAAGQRRLQHAAGSAFGYGHSMVETDKAFTDIVQQENRIHV